MNRAVILALALTAIAGRAYADTKADARAHVERGTKAYAAGNFRDALKELTLAYALDPDPELLYAIGQINVKLGDCASATTFYQRFLDTNPAANEAAVAHQAIDGCAKVNPVAPVEPVEDKPVQPVAPEIDTTPAVPVTPPPVAPPPGAPWYHDATGDVLVGAGVLAGAASGVLYWQALSRRDDADKATTYGSYNSAINSAHSDREWAIGVAVGGAALVGIGIVHYLVRDGGESGNGVSVAPTPGGAVVGYGAKF